MAYKFKPATAYIKPMKIFMYGPTYSGKTYGAIVLAVGIVMEIRKCTEEEAYKHIILIDTESRRGALYNKMGAYNYEEIKAPYHVQKLSNLVLQLNAEDQIDVIITDSLSHFWTKEGGILDLKNQKDLAGGNTYTNWINFTTQFNSMLNVLLESPKHMIITARAKSDTTLQENDKGKMVPVTIGLKSDIRDGIDFEFDIVFNVDKTSHTLLVDKGVTGMKTVYEPATPALGGELYTLFNDSRITAPVSASDIIDSIRNMATSNNLIQFVQLRLSGRKIEILTLDELMSLQKECVEKIKKDQAKK